MWRDLLPIRVWSILLVIVISLVGTPSFAQSATVVRVDPSTLSARVNDTVNLSIKIDNVANLTAIELHLSFNPSVLEVIALTNGGFVLADFTAQNIFDNSAGTIDYAIAQISHAAVQGSGVLLSMAFRAKASGSSTVALRTTQAAPAGFLLSDSDGISIPASWVAGNVNVIVGSSPSATSTQFGPTATHSTSVAPTATATPTATSTPTSTSVSTSSTPTATPNPTPTLPAGILGTHIVRRGESLYCIGRAYKVTPRAIANENHLWWPYIIFPNQSLRIPNVLWSSIPAGPVCQSQFNATASVPTPTLTPTTIATQATATATAVHATCRAYYTVRQGDNLYRIAIAYNTSYQAIALANNIPNPRLIYIGQQLCIP